ncbi:hypothetical protein DFQ14_102574 [Halopolyspora algeriensis]|uniref:Secreted protein with PEP-CTERM sorting signal n=1 Tax=Halopolyspora algeriensis TaxID=1500506 RepID=A0A368W100_9ACTN|nr:hypothetical protein [Halopolyspora algeriensis]RCW46271.1 hypothetical protein DFQ14_102574 [Halopolyspora algeriensis]TQM55673.1 hypothetical protein FHU43_0448 [Halopolyspora algeriensis]
MELAIFLAGVAVLTGLGMLLAWPRDTDPDSDENRHHGDELRRQRREAAVRAAATRRGKA